MIQNNSTMGNRKQEAQLLLKKSIILLSTH